MDTLSICEICIKINLVTVSIFQCNDICYPLRSLFIANFKMFHGQILSTKFIKRSIMDRKFCLFVLSNRGKRRLYMQA
jgi:hypothetical protein